MTTADDIIEACAQACDQRAKRSFPWASENSDVYHAQADWAAQCAKDIRALADQYGNAILCERDYAGDYIPIERAKEPTK
jgi:hypothetical protein